MYSLYFSHGTCKMQPQTPMCRLNHLGAFQVERVLPGKQKWLAGQSPILDDDML